MSADLTPDKLPATIVATVIAAKFGPDRSPEGALAVLDGFARGGWCFMRLMDLHQDRITKALLVQALERALPVLREAETAIAGSRAAEAAELARIALLHARTAGAR